MNDTNFKIGSKELYYLIINLITVKIFFTYPRFLVKTSGNAAWLQCIFVSLIAFIVFSFTISLFKYSDTQDLLDISETVGGNGAKIVVGLLLIITYLINTAITTRTLPESIKTVLLPLTPMRLLLILSGITIALGTLAGLFSIARIHALFMPVILIAFAVMLFLLLGDIRIYNIFPLWGKGTYNIFIKGVEAISVFSDLSALYILLPFLKSYPQAKKTSKKALVTSSFIITLLVFFYCTVYSYPASEEFLFPVYQMTRLIKIGDFFQRLEPIFEFFRTISLLLYSSFYLFLICHIWKKIFDLKDIKPLILPVCILLISIAYIPSSSGELSTAYRTTSFLTIPICVIMPIILGVFYRKKLKQLQEKNEG